MDPSVFGTCVRNIDIDHVAVFRLFNYGEPLLHNNLPAIFDQLAESRGFSIGHLELSTNAQHVRWDQLEDVFRRKRLNRLVVSCDGDGTPSSYERLRPPATWSKLTTFLARSRELRDQHCPNTELMTRTVIFSEADKARWTSVLEPLGWRPEFRRWINLVGASEDLSQREWYPGEGVCAYAGSDVQLYVDSTGTVVPCCAHPGAAQLGTLQTQRWSEILLAKRRRDFIHALQYERAGVEVCSKCEFGMNTDYAQYAVPGQVYS
jgi:radical SAM protein with 4Fe4S-binding SPASM domain